MEAMTTAILTRDISSDLEADIAKFDRMLEAYLAGRLEEDEFRLFRLNNGIYGQRQGGRNQMVRIKAPYGSITPEQLVGLADVADRYSRGWGHLTTRQNIQFHFVELERVPELLRELARVGLTTREACGDTVRNITGCHLAGACPFEVLDISPWAEAAFRHFLHHPYAQRLPRKFKINFSGCITDCGQAMFNDIGVVAVSRPLPDGTTEAGFRVFVAGGLGANPHPAQALEEFTPREQLLATLEAVLRTFDHYGNRDNKLRARLKWLVDTMGVDELRRHILKERRLLLASSTWPGGIPAVVEELGDAPAGVGAGLSPTPVGTPVSVRLGPGDPYKRWQAANVVIGVSKGTVSAIAYARLGDVTSDQFRALAAIQRELGATIRVTNRQNLAIRDLTADQLPVLYSRLAAIGMGEPGAELARDVVSCPGADTCNLAVTQSRGLADDIGKALEGAGLADVGGVRVNISGCTNSCGQHHTADIGFHGVERRAHGQPAPGYQLLLGGHIGQTQVEFAERALRLPAKACGEATVRIVGRYADERHVGEDFAAWLARVGGPKAVAAGLADLDDWPSPEERPDYYIDFDETGPYVAEVGTGECAGA
jgi:sulfite reductase beta subunit-like hemoprotein